MIGGALTVMRDGSRPIQVGSSLSDIQSLNSTSKPMVIGCCQKSDNRSNNPTQPTKMHVFGSVQIGRICESNYRRFHTITHTT